jgi:hypothetical protein
MSILSQLFCARVRQQLSPDEDVLSDELLTMEQVRRAADHVRCSQLSPRIRGKIYRAECNRLACYAARNAQACNSHRKTRRKQLAELGIDPEKINSVLPKNSH